jgi:choice-of-anchor B domain-containing protein
MKRLLFVCFLGVATLAQGQNLNMTSLGQLTYTEILNDIWGYADGNGNEYALVGTQNGFSIVDVTVPATPVQKAYIGGVCSTWRDVKVWGDKAYVTHDSPNCSPGNPSDGLLIVDLSDIATNPNPDYWNYFFSYNNENYSRAHNIYIDENGIIYLFGANIGVGGALLLDPTVNDTAPPVVGIYDEYYLHDGMARGDTLWGGAIYQGEMVAIDVSNHSTIGANMGAATTPDVFTHNAWISQDGTHVFTTDEVSGAYVGSYDVTDLTNITEVDRVQPENDNQVIPHNTHVKGQYIFTSWYRSGVLVHDVTYPYNVIRTGQYDTSPLSGSGFNGAWGTYPFAPSGNIYVSDMEQGLFIIGFTPTQACYLEGTVSDATTSAPIATATIELLTTNISKATDLSGFYATGSATPGTFDVVYSAPGYTADTLSTTLTNGVLVTQDVALSPLGSTSIDGSVVDSNGTSLSGISVVMTDGFNTYSSTTDANGQVTFSPVFYGTYQVTAGAWGYQTDCSQIVVDANTSAITIDLEAGFYDDFSLDFGWTELSTASTGRWERGEPAGTVFNGGPFAPDQDVQGDCLDQAYVTGNDASGGAGGDDVDNGFTTLRSPSMNLNAYTDPWLSVYHWFANEGGSGNPNDTLILYLTDGSATYEIDRIDQSSTQAQWIQSSYRILDYTNNLSTVQFRAYVADLPGNGGHLVEAGIDQFEVVDSAASSIGIGENEFSMWSVYPNPAEDQLNVGRSVDGNSAVLSIVDVQGRLIQSISMEATETHVKLNVSEYEAGVYFIRSGNGEVHRWVKL